MLLPAWKLSIRLRSVNNSPRVGRRTCGCRRSILLTKRRSSEEERGRVLGSRIATRSRLAPFHQADKPAWPEPAPATTATSHTFVAVWVRCHVAQGSNAADFGERFPESKLLLDENLARGLVVPLNRPEFGGGSAIWFQPQRGPVSHGSRPPSDLPSRRPRTRQAARD